MENVKILIDGIQKEVYGLFYIYDSKYYFIYTEKEVDENNYVVLYMTQVGKETKNTENGPVDTGYMVGVEITNPEEQQKIQTSISYIVEDKKNNTINPKIQYLPMSMLANLKIISKKRFRLLKSVMTDNFKLQFDDVVNQAAQVAVTPIITTTVESSNGISNIGELNPAPVVPVAPVEPIVPVASEAPVVEWVDTPLKPLSDINNSVLDNTNLENKNGSQSTGPVVTPQTNDVNVIVDYRSKYFEEEEKNKELQAKIDELTKKLEEIKKVIE